MKEQIKMKENNVMREIKIEKLILSIGAVKNELEKACKLLQKITGRKPVIRKSKRRIPGFDVRPGLEVGCMVTIRKKEIIPLLKKLFKAGENKIKRKQICDNFFSFGIPEYIEIPGMEYDREIGIIGLDVSVVFSRKGKRVKIKKIKRGKFPRKQDVTKEEIIKFLEEELQIKAS